MTGPVGLIILDGWGMRAMTDGNAPELARTPNVDRWLATHERAVLDASGEAVGLPEGQMGNSEVGHLNLGAGRIVYQDITRIHIAIRQGELAQNETLTAGLERVKRGGGKLHLIGLLGPGGVHSHEDHLFALLRIAASAGIDPIVHVITDGRDTPPQSAVDFLEKLEHRLEEIGVGTIASLAGRYYAMDRDRRWQRTVLAYRAITEHKAEKSFAAAADGLRAAYAEGINDEFVVPFVVETGREVTIDPGDVLLFTNFRADRMRQIVRPFVVPEFDGFERPWIEDLTVLSMTRYADDLPTRVLFPEQEIHQVLAEVISQAGRRQLHAAETEKYPHVTYFFNGGEETPFPGEERILVDSPKVATYDLQPEMSAYPLTEQVTDFIARERPDFILINFANPDMVGHTGVLEAAVEACEAVDSCASRIVEAILAQGGVALVTADHGNCERMVELLTGQPHTYHTTNPVFLIPLAADYILLKPRGILADVAPTILDLLGLEKPEAMTGSSLVEGIRDRREVP